LKTQSHSFNNYFSWLFSGIPSNSGRKPYREARDSETKFTPMHLAVMKP